MKFLLTYSALATICTNSANAYITSLSQDGAAPWKKTSFANPPANVEVDDVFRQEYKTWANRYGKSTDDEARFENFKLNYMLQMQHNKRTGQFADLNEFGDSKFCAREKPIFRPSDPIFDHYENSRPITSHPLSIFLF